MEQLLLLLTFALFTTSGFGQAGALDTTFGIGGKIIPPSDPGDYLGRMALQPDGKIVAVGGNFVHPAFLVVRYLPNGAIDEGFGNNGRVSVDLGTPDADAGDVAVQPDGKIVVVGNARYSGANVDFAVVRLHPDGSLDSTFSQDGIATTDFGNNLGLAISVALHEGKIVVAGFNTNNPLAIALARYNADGSPDSTFSQDGRLTTAFGPSSSIARDVAVQPDGKIIIAGSVGNSFFGVARYQADGTLDSTFSNDGRTSTSFGGNLDQASTLVLQPDGKIVEVGGTGIMGATYAIMARYLPDGALDNTFGTGGKVKTNLGQGQVGEIALQPDGKLVIAGTSGVTSSDFTLLRYDVNGNLDPDFGGDGMVTTKFTPYASGAQSVALQPDGKILALGEANNSVVQYIALARYLSDLSLGVLDFPLAPQNLLIYPNPLRNDATLQYELAQEETVTIQLTDMQGKLVHTLISQEKRGAGKQQEPVRLPETLPAGHYVLTIGTARGQVSVQVVK